MPTTTGKDVFKQIQDAIEAVLKPYRLTLKSGGTKGDWDLDQTQYPVDPAKGFWAAPGKVTSKPPRWIVQVEDTTPTTAHASLDASGNLSSGANTPGYVNTTDGKCIGAIFRILAAVRPIGQANFEFPGWEWLLVLGFDKPLPARTSGDALTNFDPVAGTIDHGSGTAKQTYPLSIVGVVTTPVGMAMHPAPPAPTLIAISYPDATNAIDRLLSPAGPPGANVYDGTNPADVQRLAAEFAARLVASAAPVSVPTSVAPNTTLLGIPASVYRQIDAALGAGKTHLIFYGPPGTGKTTLAQYVAQELSPDPSAADAYVLLTASSSWSSQDLIGGYQPMGPGQMGFIPGVLVRNFDRPLVIDELNRCPIDKVIGPLFSVLSGQATTLPYRVDVANPDSDFYVILPVKPPTQQNHEYAPDPFWRMICTLNTIDKTQLGQISYALSRRFAWIKIGVPPDLEDFVATWCHTNGIVPAKPTTGTFNPVAAMWRAVNTVREIGGAPIIDFIKCVRQMNPLIDVFATLSPDGQAIFLDALRMYVLPLMDGVALFDAEEIGRQLTAGWSLSAALSASLDRDLSELAS